MVFYRLLLFSFLISSFKSFAQDNDLLISKQLIENITEAKIYLKLVDEGSDKRPLKKEYAYIDSISTYKIQYKSEGLKINGLLVKPKKEGIYPVIIYNRGGNRDFGALTIGHALIPMGHLASKGYIVIASQYRGNAGSEGKEEFGGKDVKDVLILTEVVKEINGADTTNIGMYGWSRGGMMTFLALTQASNIKAAVVGGAVSNQYRTVEDRPEMEDKVLTELIPDFKVNREKELDKRSAIKWVHKFPKDVPVLMLHGNADWRVKPEQSLELAMEFEKYRIPYRLIIFEGGDHGLTEHRSELNAQVLQWFDRFLKNNEPIPVMKYHGR